MMRAAVGFILLLLGLGTMAVVMQEVGESQDLDRLAEAAARHGDWVADILSNLTPEQITRILDLMDNLGVDAQEILLELAEELAEDDLDTLLEVLEGLSPRQQEAFLEALAAMRDGKDFSELTPEQQAALAAGAQNYDGDPEDYEQMMRNAQQSEGQPPEGGGEGGGPEGGAGAGPTQGNGAPLDGENTETVITEYPSSVSKGTPFTVRGEVTWAEGGVAGMPVRLYVNETKESIGQRLGDGTTDANGRFSITTTLPDDMPLRPGVNYQFVAWARPFIGDQPYDGSWSDPPFVVESETQLRLSGPTLGGPGEHVIQGWLEDLEGAPVQDAAIWVQGPRTTTLFTDDQGAFTYGASYGVGNHVVSFTFDGAEGMSGTKAEWEIAVQTRIVEGIPTPWKIVGNEVELDVRLTSDGQPVPGEQVVLSMQGQDSGDAILRTVSFDDESNADGIVGFDIDVGRVPYGEVDWFIEDSTGVLASGTLWHQQLVEASVISRYVLPSQPGAAWVEITGDGPVDGIRILVGGVSVRTGDDGTALIPAAGTGRIDAEVMETAAMAPLEFSIAIEEQFLPVLTADKGRLVMTPEGLDDGWRPYAPVLTAGGQSYPGTWSRGTLSFDTDLSPGRHDVEVSGVYPDTVVPMSVQVPVPVPVSVPWGWILALVLTAVAGIGAWYGMQALRRRMETAQDAPADILSWHIEGAPDGMPWFADAKSPQVTVRIVGDGKARVRLANQWAPVENDVATFQLPPGQHPITVHLRRGLKLHRARGVVVCGSPQDALVRTFQLAAERYQGNAIRPLSVGDLRRLLRHERGDAIIEPLSVIEAVMYDNRTITAEQAFATADQLRRLIDG